MYLLTQCLDFEFNQSDPTKLSLNDSKLNKGDTGRGQYVVAPKESILILEHHGSQPAHYDASIRQYYTLEICFYKIPFRS